MKFLNGWKTIIGLVGTAVTVGLSAGGDVARVADVVRRAADQADSVVLGCFGLLTVLGVIHKAEKSVRR